MSASVANRDTPRQLWPLLAALGVVAAHDASLLTMQGLALGGDGVLFYYPAATALAEALARGSLPFWTPYLQAGFPLLAEGQVGPLYPINLLAFGLLPTPVAYNAVVVVHRLLGTVFTFWWGRSLQLSGVASAWMALLFALTTTLGGDAVPLIETIAWIPLLFVAAERCVQRGSGWAAWPAAPVVALQWLAGFPQLALYAALASWIYLCARVAIEDGPVSQRVALVVAWTAATAIGGLLAAPQLLPTYELSGYSIRAQGIPGGLAVEKSLFPPVLMTFVLPSWRGFFESAGLGSAGYCGLLPCILALATVLVRPRVRWLVPIVVVVLVATVLAFGSYSPLFPVVRRLPGLAYFREPSRFVIVTQFGLITLFGLGWELIGAAQARFERAVGRLLQGAAVLLLLNALVAYPLLSSLRPELTGIAERFTQRYVLSNPFHVQPLAYYQAKIAALYGALLDAVSLGRPAVWVPLAVAVLGCFVWWWTRRDPRRQAWRQGLWTVLMLVDVLASAGVVRRTTDRSWITEERPTARVLKDAAAPGLCRLFWVVDQEAVTFRTENLSLLPANYNLLAGLPSAGLYTPLGFHAYYRLMERLGGVDLGFGYRPVTPDDIAADRALLDFLNVCFVLSRQPLAGFVEVAQIDGVVVYRNDHALPRAFAVDQVEVVSSSDAALAWVRAHPERLRDTAVVEQAPLAQLDTGSARAATVSVADYQPTAVRIEVEAPGTMLLIVTDTYYPGWQARLDGHATVIYRTHGVFRAVLVPAGAHRVEFRYVPVVFWRGLAIAAIAAIVVAVWAVSAARRPSGPRAVG